MSARLDPGMVPGPACARCGAEKHHTGSRWRCGPCFNAWQAQWKAKRTPEQKRATEAVRTATRHKWSPDQRERNYESSRAWRVSNREKYLAGARDWYARNQEQARAAKLAEYYRDPTKFYARNLTRKARLLNAVCEHGPGCVDAVFLADLYASVCVYCGDSAGAADHFVPLARGGAHCVENIVPACGSCNSHKSDRDPLEWLASIEVAS